MEASAVQNKGRDLLDAHALAVSDRVLAEEARDHFVAYLSGAHAYGFPSPDSDVDLKCVFVAPAGAFLGLHPPRVVFDRAEVIEGVEIDYTANELGVVLAGVLAGNGNFLERLLGESTLAANPALGELRPLVRRTLSRRVHRHYRGFARQQLAALAEAPSAKKALYVLRTALTGTHLLLTGELVTDVTALMGGYGFASAAALIEEKRKAERRPLDEATQQRWQLELGRALEGLDAARARSPLPEDPPGDAELDAWLVAYRTR